MTNKNKERLKQIDGRVKDLFKVHAADIEAGAFLRMSTVVLTEMKWLVDQLQKETKGKEAEEELETAEAI